MRGEFRIEGPGGLVYATAPEVRAWSIAGGPLPRSATHCLWDDETGRRTASARLTVDLRAAMSRAVRAGLLRERLAATLSAS